MHHQSPWWHFFSTAVLEIEAGYFANFDGAKNLSVDTDAEWNAMMAAGIIYALPPIVLLLVLRRHVVASLAMVSAGV